jgi:hypothetical protein
MANDTGKLLKEISSLSSNMDILFQELKEQNKNNSETSKGLKDLASSIKDSSKGEGMEQTFKSFTDSFAKTFSEQNNKLISSLSEKITQSFTGSVSDFLSNVPNQVAQVKAGNSPDFKSLLGGNTIKGLVKTTSSKVPGLAQGGTVEKDGLAIVGEKGPELVQLSAKSSIMDNDAYEDAENALLNVTVSKNSDLLQKVQEAMKATYGEDGVDKGSDAQPVDKFVSWLNSEYSKDELSEIKSDPDLILDEYSVFKDFVREQKMMEASKKAFEERQKEVAALKEDAKKEASVETSIPSLAEKTTIPSAAETPAAQPKVEPVKTPDSLTDKTAANLSAASSIEAMRQQILNKLPPEKRAQLESSLASSKSSLVKETTGLKEKTPESKPAPTPTGTQETTKKSTDELKSQLSSQMKELGNQVTAANQKKEQMQMTGQSSQQPSLNPKDLSDIKTLLASIYTALKSPLTISSDYPFRPNSNNF